MSAPEADELEFTRIDRALVERACAVMERAERNKLALVTAESCTGGLIAAVLSEAPGASDWLHGGFIVYTKQQKTAALGVDPALIARCRVVSEPVARAMAEGALKNSGAQLAVSCTGIAGPTGGTPAKPIGLVHFAVARAGQTTLHQECRFGDIGRSEIRMRSVEAALKLLLQII